MTGEILGAYGTVMIGKTPVGVGDPAFIVAEVGINHNGDMEIAKELILMAKEVGVTKSSHRSLRFSWDDMGKSELKVNSYG